MAKLAECVGIPDRVFFLPKGQTLIVEFKARDEKPEKAQDWYLKKLEADGHDVGWCEDFEGFMEAMRKAGVK